MSQTQGEKDRDEKTEQESDYALMAQRMSYLQGFIVGYIGSDESNGMLGLSHKFSWFANWLYEVAIMDNMTQDDTRREVCMKRLYRSDFDLIEKDIGIMMGFLKGVQAAERKSGQQSVALDIFIADLQSLMGDMRVWGRRAGRRALPSLMGASVVGGDAA